MPHTKKTFELVARILRDERRTDNPYDLQDPYEAVNDAIDHVAVCLANAFDAEGGNFDRARFLRACTVDRELARL